MTPSWRRPLVVASLCALAAGQMSGCGESPTDPPTTPCTRETVFSGDIPIPASSQMVQPIMTPRSGRLRMTVGWADPEGIIRVVLAQAPCGPDQFRDKACNVISDLFPPPNPLEESTTWLSPGAFDVLLQNFNTVEETASVNIVLSSTGCETP